MSENKNEDEIQFVVTLLSPKLGSHPDQMYITNNRLIFGAHEVEIDDIIDVNITRNKETDLGSIAVIISNMLAGTFLALTVSSSTITSAAIILLSGLLGFFVVKMINDRPSAYVSLETDDAEYRFGVADQVGVAKLFGTVKGSSDITETPNHVSKNELLTNN